ncbi:MAG: hypothetical protein ACREOG_17335 [Gemmatimonadaceae bacterium]
MSQTDSEELSFLDRTLPPHFERRIVVVYPGRMRMYVQGEWSDALIVVERGEIELESSLGARYRFSRGDVLWLTGLPLRALHNRGREPALLVAVRRTRELDPAGAQPTGSASIVPNEDRSGSPRKAASSPYSSRTAFQ